MSIGQRIRTARKRLGMTEQQFADAVGVSRGAVQQWEKDDTAPRRKIQPAVAALMGITVSELMSDDLSAIDVESRVIEDKKPTQPQVESGLSAINTDFLKPILVWEHPDELPAGEYVFVPRLNIQLSTGHGREQVDVDLIRDKPQAFRAEWIRELRLKPAGLASMRVVGDSMEPRLYAGDAVVVDTADTTVLDGKAYALWYDGGERIKRLFRLPGGGLRIVSDNGGKYPPIDLTADQCQHVRILGRVRHVASTQGL